MAELGMKSVEHLLRGWGSMGYGETVAIVEIGIMENGVLGR